MTVEHIISLLEFCLKTTYFLFQGRFFKQLQGTDMGSPISPIVAKLYIEEFETKAIITTEHPPQIWKRYVDDTFVVINHHTKRSSWNTWAAWTHTSSLLQKQQRRWVHYFPGHPGDATSWQLHHCYCIQKAHTYNVIHAVGQSLQPGW